MQCVWRQSDLMRGSLMNHPNWVALPPDLTWCRDTGHLDGPTGPDGIGFPGKRQRHFVVCLPDILCSLAYRVSFRLWNATRVPIPLRSSMHSACAHLRLRLAAGLGPLGSAPGTNASWKHAFHFQRSRGYRGLEPPPVVQRCVAGRPTWRRSGAHLRACAQASFCTQ